MIIRKCGQYNFVIFSSHLSTTLEMATRGDLTPPASDSEDVQEIVSPANSPGVREQQQQLTVSTAGGKSKKVKQNIVSQLHLFIIIHL